MRRLEEYKKWKKASNQGSALILLGVGGAIFLFGLLLLFSEGEQS
jgi:hypothetical protein